MKYDLINLSGLQRGDGDSVRHRSLHRVRDADGANALQVVRDGPEGVQQEGVQRDDRVHPSHQDDARVQERDEAELRHQVGDRRRRKTGLTLFCHGDIWSSSIWSNGNAVWQRITDKLNNGWIYFKGPQNDLQDDLSMPLSSVVVES